MFKVGMKIHTVRKLMEKLSCWNFIKQKDFDTGELNLIYYNGTDTLCFYFDKNKRLIKAI